MFLIFINTVLFPELHTYLQVFNNYITLHYINTEFDNYVILFVIIVVVFIIVVFIFYFQASA